MKPIVRALESIRKKCIRGEYDKAGFIIGKDWVEEAKNVKCLIASRVTRTTIAKASQEKVRLIISIFPPIFTEGYEQRIGKSHRELLKIIIENKIAIYSLGVEWLTAEESGYDYLLNLLDFEFKKPFELTFSCRETKKGKLQGRFGERKKKIPFNDFLALIQQLLQNEKIKSLGYSKHPIRKIAIISELSNEAAIFEIQSNAKIDAIIIGDISYEALLAAQLVKLPIVILSRRNLENLMLNAIRRKIMEEVTIDLPEILSVKQDDIGTIYSG